MKSGKYVQWGSFLMVMAMSFSFVAKQSFAQDLKSAALTHYLAQLEPSEADKEKCKESTCAAAVAEVSKLSPDLQQTFVVNPFSEAVIQALPPQIAASLQNNREALRSFDGNAPTANHANDSFTIGEDGRPVFGGTNPQKIVWGQLLNQSANSNLPQRNLSYIGEGSEGGGYENTCQANCYEPSGGEQGGQSGTTSGTGTTSGAGNSDPEQGGVVLPRPDGLKFDKATWEAMFPEGSSQKITGGAVERDAVGSNVIGLRHRHGVIYHPLSRPKNNFDQDSSQVNPTVSEADKAAIQKEIQSRLGGRRPGATDPAFLKGDQAEPTYNRPLTKEEQEALNRYTGTGGYYRNRDAQAGAGIDVAPQILGGVRPPAPISGECDQPGASADCNQ